MQPEKGFRITRQRRIMIEEMRSMPCHPTASELHEVVRRKLPNISLATVYRNLEIMAGKGLIQKIVIDSRLKRFDPNPEVHYHARCIRCGTINDISASSEIISLFRNRFDNLENFKILDARIELLGHCEKCVEDKPLS
jgi:Fe2+ or Zn2+ uptake regulation protein